MSELIIAMKMGLLSSNLRNLTSGEADLGTAMKLGVTTSALQDFLNGNANITMSSKLGLLTSDLQILLDSIGSKGAIGLVLGLLMKK